MIFKKMTFNLKKKKKLYILNNLTFKLKIEK